MPTLRHLSASGFRSLRDVRLRDLPRCGVLIGANGSGKSNFLALLQMVAHVGSHSLSRYVGQSGGARSQLFRGTTVSRAIHVCAEFENERDWVAYDVELRPAPKDRLVFENERAGRRTAAAQDYEWISLGSGHFESGLTRERSAHPVVRGVSHALRHLSYFHVHDTSPTSPMRSASRVRDARYLRSDGSNLAAYIHALKTSPDAEFAAAWRRIIGLVRRIAPFVKDLSPAPLHPTPTTLPAELDEAEEPSESVLLDWIDDCDQVFGSSHLSDGTLRAIALVTALAQPTSRRPRVIAIDEPELGLHPAALNVLSELMRSVSATSQVIVATQSPALLDHFMPDETIVTERVDGATDFRRLDSGELAAWLGEYTLSELFDKNVLGGRP